MSKLFRFLAVLGVLIAQDLFAATYYISPTGSDTNNGTSTSTPWRTIDRLNQLSSAFQPGDRILFLRGGVFRGKLNILSSGTATNRIEIGAYGTGAEPVLSGSRQVTGWTVHSGNIWKANVGQKVYNVFHNGQLMTLARYPNSGWLTNDLGTSTTTKDAALGQSNGYWNGATMVMRTTNWSYDTAYITNFNSSTKVLTHTSTGNTIGDDAWGYFLRNKLSELDAPGEWFYNPVSGVLYLWCPGNVDPNASTVEVSVTDNAIYLGWQRSYIWVHDLAFKHQFDAALRLSGSINVEVGNCSFSDLYQALRTTGTGQNYHHLDIQRTYASAAHILDQNSTVQNCTFTDICMEPGLGESNWGYFGLRANGTGMVIRDNVLQNIGYIGIVAEQNAIVERNYVRNAIALLNDGGGIALDNANGMIIRDNVVMDLVGNLESSAVNGTNYHSISYGIYFGNISIRNTTVQRNTVANCHGSGIHVDHTMVSSGNQVRDNILYNNEVQLSISDYSNYNTPGAVAPFHVPSFNTVYSGNIMYCLTREQLCMRQLHVYSANWVDYGTFQNNYYHNAYNDRSIELFNTFAGVRKFFTLERWQYERSEDAGSGRSPLNLEGYGVTEALSANLVSNGTFAGNITGWSGWPAQGLMTHQPTLLDNGALRVVFNNNSTYNEFTLKPTTNATVTNGYWYRMRFSIQSNMHGEVKAGFKGNSQVSGPNMVYSRQVPFDSQRRDVTMIFQSNLTDAGVCSFTNFWTEGTYWIDNVELQRVSVTQLDPNDMHRLLCNPTATAQSLSLPAGTWTDVHGSEASGSVTIAPFSSRVFYKSSSAAAIPGNALSLKMYLGGAYDSATGQMRDDLRAQNLVPSAEPYTALGLAVDNPNVTMSNAVRQATGSQALVDWVAVELRNPTAPFAVVGRRAAILRKDGTVVAADGNMLTFLVPTVGKLVGVRHRNHLGIMTTVPVATNGQTVDVTVAGTACFGTENRQAFGSVLALWAGDVQADGQLKYTGPANDRDPILLGIGGVVPTNTTTVYSRADVNMDGVVKYTGAGNDRDAILVNIGGVVPTQVRNAQLP
ncbi:MAG TPA: right-handed parallel beta-helix repeat-containing protein [Flavobacteriales bacterium]